VKSFDLESMASAFGGEYVLGMKDLHSDACYLIYGRLEQGEGGRLIRPGPGHEEILCAVDGPLTVHTDCGDMVLQRGSAIHINQEESFSISNPSNTSVVYILAGGMTRQPLDS
jgi:hypothetical protein